MKHQSIWTTHHLECSREIVFVCQIHFPLRLEEGQHQEVWRTDLTEGKKEEGKEKGNDRIGEYRDWSVNYQSYDPVDWENPSSAEKEILNTKAYIDMPNIRAVSFLDPRDIFFGITVHF